METGSENDEEAEEEVGVDETIFDPLYKEYLDDLKRFIEYLINGN